MLEGMTKTLKVLEAKLPLLEDAIEKADPTTKEYREALDGYNGTMMVISNINQTLVMQNQMRAQHVSEESKPVEEEK